MASKQKEEEGKNNLFCCATQFYFFDVEDYDYGWSVSRFSFVEKDLSEEDLQKEFSNYIKRFIIHITTQSIIMFLI